MRTLRLCVCLLVFVTLFIFGGCKTKHGFQQVTVNISNCTANPDPVPSVGALGQGDKVDWESSDGHDYKVSFSDASEPTPNPFTVKHGVSNPARPIKGHNRCQPYPQIPGAYYCKYNLTRDNQSTACPDPGVIVKP